jgi:hypothetical protein
MFILIASFSLMINQQATDNAPAHVCWGDGVLATAT